MEQRKEVTIPLLERHTVGTDSELKSVDQAELASPACTPVKTIEPPVPHFYTTRLLTMHFVCILIGIAVTTFVWDKGPHATTIPIFLGSAFVIVSFVALRWYSILASTGIDPTAIWIAMGTGPRRGPAGVARISFTLFTGLSIWLVYLAVLPIPTPNLPALDSTGDRYFIAINLYNNEDILPNYTRELSELINHLGPENVYVSIYESNSVEDTPVILRQFGRTLQQRDIDHRIISISDDGRKEFALNSMERIKYLSTIRNKALEPIQSADEKVRIPEWRSFTKIIFMNDVIVKWQDMVALVGTKLKGHEEEEYDMVCAVDHDGGGSYDTWVGRDICGTPFVGTWPYVKESLSVQAMRSDETFPLATCWHGAVVLRAEPFLYRSDIGTGKPTHTIHLESRIHRHGALSTWQIIDNSSDPDSRISPDLAVPLQFRTSEIEECVHSECFLLPYDLHRMYRDVEGRPRIWMNPAVRLAYVQVTWDWNNFYLRLPIVVWWRGIWSHRIGWYMVQWITERKERLHEACTWAALKIPTDGRCPPLPGKPGPNDHV